jgi:AraC-like DNA-binding protein
MSSGFGKGLSTGPASTILDGSFHALRACGVDVDALKVAVSPYVELGRPGFWGSALGARGVQQAAGLVARVSGNPRLGLSLAREMPPGSLGVLDYLLRTAATLRHASELSNKYGRLAHDYVRLELSEEGGLGCVRLIPADGVELHPLVVDYRLARLIYQARILLARPSLMPLEVRLSYSRPGSTTAYTDTFGRNVTLSFGRAVAALVFDAALLDEPLPSEDARLHQILLDEAQRLLEAEPHDQSFAGRVRCEIMASMDREGRPNIAHIARRLHSSERTIRRRLSEEGTGFYQILDSVRAELATWYLEDPGATTEAVAARLGFESSNAFRRARRRWKRLGLHVRAGYSPT